MSDTTRYDLRHRTDVDEIMAFIVSELVNPDTFCILRIRPELKAPMRRALDTYTPVVDRHGSAFQFLECEPAGRDLAADEIYIYNDDILEPMTMPPR